MFGVGIRRLGAALAGSTSALTELSAYLDPRRGAGQWLGFLSHRGRESGTVATQWPLWQYCGTTSFSRRFDGMGAPLWTERGDCATWAWWWWAEWGHSNRAPTALQTSNNVIRRSPSFSPVAATASGTRLAGGRTLPVDPTLLELNPQFRDLHPVPRCTPQPTPSLTHLPVAACS